MSESTPKRYHPAHVAIHWLMALLVFMMLGIGKFVMPGVSPEDPQKVMMLQSHTYIGGAIAILLLIRIVLLFTTKRPAPADAGNAFLNLVGKAVHGLLYLFLLGIFFSFQRTNGGIYAYRHLHWLCGLGFGGGWRRCFVR